MGRIVYYVAVSLDGFIAGPNEDISGFVQSGPGVDQYLQDLQGYDTVIMGRRTYEFGYKWGIKPGEPAYPHMQHYVFSDSLQLPPNPQVQVCACDVDVVNRLKADVPGDIYLAGGGEFAGWLLDHNLIDIVKIKLNPLILGDGTRVFGSSTSSAKLTIVGRKDYEDGLQILTYEMNGKDLS
jgi:dihydrofolate reductase